MAASSIPALRPVQYEELVRRALAEDLGLGGDLTTDTVVPPELAARARIFSRRPGRLAGVAPALAAFTILDHRVQIAEALPDGSDLATGSEVARLAGPARALLTAERTALNLLTRLSGIATLTRDFVAAVAGTRARVVCTRKTTPGLRALEKYAVRCGGGSNHRFGLDDAVLIKDNHLVAAGGVGEAVARARAAVGHTVKVEVEVDTLEQLAEALGLGVDTVLLDNMSVGQLQAAVAMVAGRVVTEASGGVTLGNVAAVAATGVDLISVGALTHSAPALDLSMELELSR